MIPGNRLDLNLLTVFITIYREGSLTRASEILHLTQPAVSHSLARLREQFDDALFRRQGNRMVPTPLAQRLASSVHPALSEIHSALNAFHEFTPEQQPRVFNIALRDVLEATFLPPLMQEMTQYPGIEVVSQRVPRREMEQQLAAGKLDFAVDVLLPVSDQTAHERLHEDRLVVVARRGSAIARQGMTLERYLAAGHVLVSSRAEGQGLEDFALSARGHRRRIALRCQHYFAACRVAAETDLLVTMPEAYADIIGQYLDVALLEPPEGMPEVDVHLYWHRQHEREPALNWFRERLHALKTPGGSGDQSQTAEEQTTGHQGAQQDH
ncbi:LysR family transcriptional regulator [Halovibrio salipaludis]|uniref:LysR family transcriptional regulator n=1 Tax=Halovibrio salipaludis TaxID=2032626 RepID=UPI001E5A6E87|nr:LysR family transcriptional regulator [Halovibrio salipaludis]